MTNEPSSDKTIFAPNAMARIRAKKAELTAQVAAGDITPVEGARLLRDFQSLTIAHVREHGPEGA